MSDWYQEAHDDYITDIAEDLNIDRDIVQRVYTRLENDGLIDYDIEKEFLSDFVEEEEDD